MFKKKGTKITALILAAMMTASAFLSGCGGTDSAGSQNSAASDTRRLPKQTAQRKALIRIPVPRKKQSLPW